MSLQNVEMNLKDNIKK